MLTQATNDNAGLDGIQYQYASTASQSDPYEAALADTGGPRFIGSVDGHRQRPKISWLKLV